MIFITHPWRSRHRRNQPAARRWLPSMSLYWRRMPARVPRPESRRRPAAAGHALAPMTFVCVHQHFHQAVLLRGQASAQSGAAPQPIASTVLATRIIERATTKHMTMVHRGMLSSVERTFGATTVAPAASAKAAPTPRPCGDRVPITGVRRYVFHAVAFARPTPCPAADTSNAPAAAWPRTRNVESRLNPSSSLRMRAPVGVSRARIGDFPTRARQVSALLPRRTVRAVSSVALDWRAPRDKATVQRSAAAAAIPPEDRAAARRQSPVAVVEPQAEAKGSVPRDKASALALDPSTIDRLAENVMQRIDRRIRIERERRGL